MSDKAKDAYHLYHVELGTKDAPAFERLSMREQDAWGEVAGIAKWYRDRTEELTAEVRRKQSRIDTLEFVLDSLKEELTEAQLEMQSQFIQIELALRTAPKHKNALGILQSVRERIAGLGDRKKARV